MSEFTVAQAAELLGVSADTIRRLADKGGLKTSRSSPGGRRRIDGADLARHAASRASTTPQPAMPQESARNHFPGLVTKVTKDKVMAQVEVQAGPFRVVSLVSREAVDELDLQPGSYVVAQVKSTNVVIELPHN